MGSTVREVAKTWWHHYVNEDLIGTPEHVAAAMGALMDEVGGDGFLLHTGVLTRTYISDITEHLVPALRALGLTRSEYTHAQLRDNLLAF